MAVVLDKLTTPCACEKGLLDSKIGALCIFIIMYQLIDEIFSSRSVSDLHDGRALRPFVTQVTTSSSCHESFDI